MAKEKDPKKMDAPDAKAAPKAKTESTNKLFIMMFAGVIVIQLVIIIVAVYFFLNKDHVSSGKSEKSESTEKVAEKKDAEAKKEGTPESEALEGKVFGYTTKDIIINPKGTSGKRYLMAQIGIFVSDELMKKELSEEREAQVNGIINSFLASKTIDILDNIDVRDSLAVDLKSKLNSEIPGNKIKKVYFSKFVIQ
jgi:flagellar basal body-associated protein FliL